MWDCDSPYYCGGNFAYNRQTLLDELPDKQERISLSQAVEMRKELYMREKKVIGLHDASVYLKKSSSVDEAIKLYHNIMDRLFREQK